MIFGSRELNKVMQPACTQVILQLGNILKIKDEISWRKMIIQGQAPFNLEYPKMWTYDQHLNHVIRGTFRSLSEH